MRKRMETVKDEISLRGRDGEKEIKDFLFVVQ
jgi:hypothetical protein